MHVDRLTIRPDMAAEQSEGAVQLRRARWLAAALTLSAMSAILFASGLAVVMSLS